MTTRLLPMLATPGRPADVAGPDWGYEFKWDGVRALVAVGAGEVRVRSRRGNDVTGGYPELAGLADAVGPPVLLDGEIVAFDADGVPSFAALQPRMHLRDPHRVRVAAGATPVTFLAFDVLLLDRTWLLDRPYTERRARLEDLGLAGAAWSTPPRSDDLHATLETAARRGLEGVVAKRLTSRYRPGERSPDWRKLRLMLEQELVVGGYRRGERGGGVGALLLGTWSAGEPGRPLRYAGAVGSGFTDREIARLAAEMAARARPTSPFADAPADPDAVWVDPELVVQVRFREWTPQGRVRQATYRGQRTDVDPTSVTRDP